MCPSTEESACQYVEALSSHIGGGEVTSAKAGPPLHVKITVAERRERAVKMRMAGARWPELVEALGYASTGAACTDVKRALEIARKDLALAVEDLREQELQRLDDLEATARRVLDEYETKLGAVEDALIAATQNGDEGAVALAERLESRLSDQRLAAIDRLLKISTQRSQLLGLNQPTKVEHTGKVLYAIEGVNLDALT